VIDQFADNARGAADLAPIPAWSPDGSCRTLTAILRGGEVHVQNRPLQIGAGR
jgi:hypothetical protein